MSQNWLKSVQSTDRFATTRWEESLLVPVTTLDALIEQYGEPRFCKVDVEGYEHEVLLGLSHPLAFLSFEYQPVLPEAAAGCIDRLSELGDYEYNWTVSELPWLRSKFWVTPAEMWAHLQGLHPQARTGDIYARRKEQ